MGPGSGTRLLAGESCGGAVSPSGRRLHDPSELRGTSPASASSPSSLWHSATMPDPLEPMRSARLNEHVKHVSTSGSRRRSAPRASRRSVASRWRRSPTSCLLPSRSCALCGKPSPRPPPSGSPPHSQNAVLLEPSVEGSSGTPSCFAAWTRFQLHAVRARKMCRFSSSLYSPALRATASGAGASSDAAGTVRPARKGAGSCRLRVVISSPSLMSHALSRTCSSCRTLPGHS